MDGGRSRLEVERTFEVPDDLALPAAEQLTDVASVSAPVELGLHAVYLDTPALALASAGITLRRCTGGDDDGWHLQLPCSGDRREELHVPLDESAEDRVPAGLLDRVRVHVRDRPLVAVVRVRTRRTLRLLLGERGRVLAELCDDRVSAERLLPEPSSTHWRTWEVAPVGGDETLLAEVAGLLLRSGAAGASSTSTLARALGSGWRRRETVRRPGPDSVAADVLLSFLGRQLEALEVQDPLVRVEAPDAVHQMRVACRRTRAVLSTCAPLLLPGAGDHLRAELRWLGRVLGEARDAEVLQARLELLLDEQPESPMLGLVAHRVTAELRERYASGMVAARQTLDGERYFRLLDGFEELLHSPPLGARAGRPAREELVVLVERDWRRLIDRLNTAKERPAGAQRDLALHEVRKAAKRLRYAAQSATPVLDGPAERPAERLAAAGAAIQGALGEHHDSAAARALLDEMRAGLDGAGGQRVLDDLCAREWDRTKASEKEFRTALRMLPRKHRGLALAGSAR